MSEAKVAEQRVLGQFYRVPAVRVTIWRGFQGWLPVIGPKHEDHEIIHFGWSHFHIDWRFAPWPVFNRSAGFRGPSGVYGVPIACPDTRGDKVIEEGPALKLMKYKRELPPFPRDLATWLPTLRSKYACAKLTNGHCPHRGIPVSAMRREGDILECPGHGLRWNAITGEAVCE